MEVSKTVRRKWWVAALLSLLTTGLGQLYNGQLKKAVIFYLLPVFMLPVIAVLALVFPSMLLPAGFVLAAVCTYIVIDAIVVSARIGENFQPRRYNRPLVYFGVFIVLNLVMQSEYMYLVKKHIVQAYKLPAASMEPTLLVGDHILIDKFSKESKSPRRGDIAVFEFPENPNKDYIKRVIGLPGDTVEIRDKQLYIKGEPYVEDYIVHRDEGVQAEGKSPRDNFGPVKVPDGSYFTMGDNRDRSFDSRFWGFVSKDKIHGVARVIYWSWDGNNSNVRWDRVGNPIQ